MYILQCGFIKLIIIIIIIIFIIIIILIETKSKHTTKKLATDIIITSKVLMDIKASKDILWHGPLERSFLFHFKVDQLE